jgi:hypothetical protein
MRGHRVIPRVGAWPESKRKVVLSWKKEPKNFHPYRCAARIRQDLKDKRLFASFSSEKEDSSFLPAANMAPHTV